LSGKDGNFIERCARGLYRFPPNALLAGHLDSGFAFGLFPEAAG